jgi:acetoin utilization protein AcuB
MSLRNLKHMPHVVAVMTPFPYSIDIDAGLTQAMHMMQEHKIRHLPVMEQGKLVSVLTDRDIKMALDPSVGLPPREQLTVRNACVIDAYIVNTNAPLDRVLLEMAERHIGSALVVKEQRLAGIFTASDACRFLGDLLSAQFPVYTGGGDDAA